MIDQRADERHDVADTGVEVMDQESGVQFQGAARNVSGGGLLFHATMEPPVGADLDVTVQGKRSKLRVTRVGAAPGGGFDVAGTLVKRRR